MDRIALNPDTHDSGVRVDRLESRNRVLRRGRTRARRRGTGDNGTISRGRVAVLGTHARFGGLDVRGVLGVVTRRVVAGLLELNEFRPNLRTRERLAGLSKRNGGNGDNSGNDQRLDELHGFHL